VVSSIANSTKLEVQQVCLRRRGQERQENGPPVGANGGVFVRHLRRRCLAGTYCAFLDWSGFADIGLI
jgi:hypothetical protein